MSLPTTIEQALDEVINHVEELKEYWSERVEFEYGEVRAINPDQLISRINDIKERLNG